jgi:hypothetical protein
MLSTMLRGDHNIEHPNKKKVALLAAASSLD